MGECCCNSEITLHEDLDRFASLLVLFVDVSGPADPVGTADFRCDAAPDTWVAPTLPKSCAAKNVETAADVDHAE